MLKINIRVTHISVHIKAQYRPHFIHCVLSDVVSSTHLTCKIIQCWALGQEFQWDFNCPSQSRATDLTEYHCDKLKRVKI